MKKLICTASNFKGLTKGKIYFTKEEDALSYRIRDDSNILVWKDKFCFEEIN
jgi:hypothetical protein